MSYYFNKELKGNFEEVVEKVRKAIHENGFGVVSEINMHEKFKEKLNVDFRKYKILGACKPSVAYHAVQHEDKIGTMLPCNIVVQEKGPNEVEVAAIDPVASMMAIKNKSLGEVALGIREELKNLVDNL